MAIATGFNGMALHDTWTVLTPMIVKSLNLLQGNKKVFINEENMFSSVDKKYAAIIRRPW
jgi:hypothetical protein